MKGKKIQIFVGMLVLLALIFSGCTEQNNNEPNGNGNGATNGNEFRMNTIQLHNDIDVQTDYTTYMTMDYKSMEEGDTLIFMDTISEIQYLNDVDATKIVFKINVTEIQWKSTQFYFMGNITSSYKVGDFVRITVTIKHVILTDVQGMDLDIEIYEQAWRSEEYFRNNLTTSMGGFYPMPIDTITKI
jgi:hypothetical protein